MISVGSGGIFTISMLCCQIYVLISLLYLEKDREHKFRISYDIILLQYIYYGSYSRAANIYFHL